MVGKSKVWLTKSFYKNKLKEYQKETEGCTFQPEIYSYDYRNPAMEGVGDFYERNNMWKLHKDMKVDEQRNR